MKNLNTLDAGRESSEKKEQTERNENEVAQTQIESDQARFEEYQALVMHYAASLSLKQLIVLQNFSRHGEVHSRTFMEVGLPEDHPLVVNCIIDRSEKTSLFLKSVIESTLTDLLELVLKKRIRVTTVHFTRFGFLKFNVQMSKRQETLLAANDLACNPLECKEGWDYEVHMDDMTYHRLNQALKARRKPKITKYSDKIGEAWITRDGIITDRTGDPIQGVYRFVRKSTEENLNDGKSN